MYHTKFQPREDNHKNQVYEDMIITITEVIHESYTELHFYFSYMKCHIIKCKIPVHVLKCCHTFDKVIIISLCGSHLKY